MNDNLNILQIDGWNTPATNYPLSQIGKASIVRSKYTSGFYRMEGIQGFHLYAVNAPIKVTQLNIYKSGWMVDDPLHWLAMQWYLEEAPAGALVCAGLGLGLMAHIASQHKKFTRIHIVEIEKDVIDLIAPFLPDDKRIEVVHADFEKYTPDFKPDCVFWDLAVGAKQDTVWQLARGIAQTSSLYADTPAMYFGLRSKSGSAFSTLEDVLPGMRNIN